MKTQRRSFTPPFHQFSLKNSESYRLHGDLRQFDLFRIVYTKIRSRVPCRTLPGCWVYTGSTAQATNPLTHLFRSGPHASTMMHDGNLLRGFAAEGAVRLGLLQPVEDHRGPLPTYNAPPRHARARHREAIARLASSHAPCAVTSLCGPYTVRMASHTSPKHCPACSMPPSWQMLPALGWRALPACSPRALDRCPCKLPRSARCPNPSPGLQAMWFTNSDHIGAHCDVHATQHYGSSYGVTSDETKGAT